MTQVGKLLTDIFALYSNGAILVYDITDEDSFFKVHNSCYSVFDCHNKRFNHHHLLFSNLF